MISSRTFFRPAGAALILALAAVPFAGRLQAIVNEAISLALEAATPYVEKGFKVREDDWSGEVEPGKPLLVRHQLFRGNEYWFWAGTSVPGATIEVDIFDSKGNSVGLESFTDGPRAGVRALPQKTGTYFIRVIAKYGDPAESGDGESGEAAARVGGNGGTPATVDWGLVYGYR